MKNFFILACLFAACPLPLLAQAPPNLKNQAAWGEKEKQDFLKYLKSGQSAPVSGDVKDVKATGSDRFVLRRARYVTVGAFTDTMVADTGDGQTRTGTTTVGPKLLVGGHLFSWVRYYGGLRYNRISAAKKDGRLAHLSHLALPAGIEMALIPLGTPQTRYVLLRGGVSYHNIYGGKSSDFNSSILGWRAAWNLGVGYEWQIPDSRWRVNVLAEAYRTFTKEGPPRYSGYGLTSGLAYTF